MSSLGIDTGGTFTDLVLYKGGALSIHKIPSTPGNPAEAFLRGIEQLCQGSFPESITHGSTVATNSLLERKGGRVALVTTSGFEDVLKIGRQTRPSLYDLEIKKPVPLMERENIFGISERTLYDGTIEKKPEKVEIEQVAKEIGSREYDSIAICFLHSYANPENEKFAARILEQTGIPVSASHVVLPEYREYERFSTTSLNAYVSPKMGAYLNSVEDGLPASLHFRIMQSNGGSISALRARKEAARTILSGPAGGVVGAFEVARSAGFEKVITFDMGGTSTDVSLCDGGMSMRTTSVIAGYPVAIPMVDIHTVGAGGGSIAWFDQGGALHVGPQSAGADPGPVCYGRGSRLTVTDANLCLGRMSRQHVLGGSIKPNLDRVRGQMLKFAKDLGMTDDEAAEGIIRVANATMERAIRVISVERGNDPRHFSLVAFGGAGPMHACDLARSLAIPNIIVPNNAGVLSALGLLMADVVKDFSQTVLSDAESLSISMMESLFSQLEQRARGILAGEGFTGERSRMERFLDMRYTGQSYEVTVPMTADFISRFHARHRRLYGHSNISWPVEVVNIRLVAKGIVESPLFSPKRENGKPAKNARKGVEGVLFGGKRLETPFYERDMLLPGTRLQGPAIIMEMSATTVVAPDYGARIDRYGNIIMSPN
jgi:N-methylhydantoinase A